MEERRRHVRVRPFPDYPLQVILKADPVSFALQVFDLSVRGLGLQLTDIEPAPKVGDELRLSVGVPGAAPFEARAILRHLGAGPRTGMAGVELVGLTDEQGSLLRKCVGELLERGMPG